MLPPKELQVLLHSFHLPSSISLSFQGDRGVLARHSADGSGTGVLSLKGGKWLVGEKQGPPHFIQHSLSTYFLLAVRSSQVAPPSRDGAQIVNKQREDGRGSGREGQWRS